MNVFFFLVTSYFLGAIPFGYIFSKIAGKNILEIGWRKTSGSNVFRNVGFLAGLLTGICDLAKGFLAVWLAKTGNASLKIQALVGVSAIIGHNWSIFIKFAGGRGIATLIGTFLALSPKILFLAIAFPLFLAIVWNSSLATILFLILLNFFSWKENQFSTLGFLSLFSLAPIFIKRLSPIKELSLTKPEIMRNRFLFDDDKADTEPRIKKITKSLFSKK